MELEEEHQLLEQMLCMLQGVQQMYLKKSTPLNELITIRRYHVW